MDYPPSTYWLALQATPGLGAVKLRQLWQQGGSVQAAWQSLAQTEPEKDNKLQQALAQEQKISDRNIKILTIDREDYPQSLINIADISPVLFVEGELLN